ncbi:MAG: hypothetical protein U0792_18640 [Gemmataceae bacterium]
MEFRREPIKQEFSFSRGGLFFLCGRHLRGVNLVVNANPSSIGEVAGKRFQRELRPRSGIVVAAVAVLLKYRVYVGWNSGPSLGGNHNWLLMQCRPVEIRVAPPNGGHQA